MFPAYKIATAHHTGMGGKGSSEDVGVFFKEKQSNILTRSGAGGCLGTQNISDLDPKSSAPVVVWYARSVSDCLYLFT